MTAELGVEAPLRTERERAESVPEGQQKREVEVRGHVMSNDDDGDDRMQHMSKAKQKQHTHR